MTWKGINRLRIVDAAGATVALLVHGKRADNGGWLDPSGGQFTEGEQIQLYDFAHGTGHSVYIGDRRIASPRLVWGDCPDARGST